MPEWLKGVGAAENVSWETILARLLLAAFCGAIVAATFVASTRRLVGTFPLLFTVVLLTILVAMTTVVIGDNTARAFGLVGALSIIRFRTVVEDTRDTAFVIFAVVVGMAIGAGHLVLCLVGIPIVAAAAIGMGQFGTALGLNGVEHRLEVRVAIDSNLDAKITEILQQHLAGWRLLSVSTAKQGTALDMNYAVRMREPLGEVTLLRTLQAIEGVMSVEVKEL